MGKLWNFFRFSLVSLAMLLPILSAKATTDETKLSLSLKNANLPTILKEIKNQTKYDFMYNSKEIDINKTISVNVKNGFGIKSVPYPFRFDIHDERQNHYLEKETGKSKRSNLATSDFRGRER